jgi:hypothetical protein
VFSTNFEGTAPESGGPRTRPSNLRSGGQIAEPVDLLRTGFRQDDRQAAAAFAPTHSPAAYPPTVSSAGTLSRRRPQSNRRQLGCNYCPNLRYNPRRCNKPGSCPRNSKMRRPGRVMTARPLFKWSVPRLPRIVATFREQRDICHTEHLAPRLQRLVRHSFFESAARCAPPSSQRKHCGGGSHVPARSSREGAAVSLEIVVFRIAADTAWADSPMLRIDCAIVHTGRATQRESAARLLHAVCAVPSSRFETVCEG